MFTAGFTASLYNTNKHFDVHKADTVCSASQTQLKHKLLLMSEMPCRFPLVPVQEELQTVGDFIRNMGFSGPRHGWSSLQQRHPGKQSQGLHGSAKAFLCHAFLQHFPPGKATQVPGAQQTPSGPGLWERNRIRRLEVGDAALLFIIMCLRGGDTHAISPLFVELRNDHVAHARSRCARGFLC